MFDMNRDVAIKMWLYILNKNRSILTNLSESYKASNLTEKIVQALVYGPACGWLMVDYNNPNEVLLAETMFKNKELYTLVFGTSVSVGEETSRLLSHLIASPDSQTLLSVLNLIKKNKKEESIGKILTIAIEHIRNVSVPFNQIKLLEDFVSRIEDKTDRAEAFTALLSLEEE
jgi:hypothetical protein